MVVTSLEYELINPGAKIVSVQQWLVRAPVQVCNGRFQQFPLIPVYGIKLNTHSSRWFAPSSVKHVSGEAAHSFDS